LLDEPTANLDGQTEEAVLTAVRTLMVGRTVIIAAHRPSILNLADRVISLEPVGPGLP
jgi:ABC-type multidrug transport system fused ATPase/permease subunit